MQHRVGVISDTHIPHFPALPQAIWQHFAGVELIIHAGDLSVLSVLSELETIAPVVAVQGNIEHEEVIRRLPIKREVVVGHCRCSHEGISRRIKERAEPHVRGSAPSLLAACNDLLKINPHPGYHRSYRY